MMKTKTRQTVALAILLTILTATACSAPPRAPDLGGLYSELARNEDPYRNPVILIPGILGSKLISPIDWKQVMFLFSDHRNITNDPTFTDNLLYILLESPKDN